MYVGPALDVGGTPVRRVPVKDDGMPETPELETINLRALLRSSELVQLEFRIRKRRLVTSHSQIGFLDTVIFSSFLTIGDSFAKNLNLLAQKEKNTILHLRPDLASEVTVFRRFLALSFFANFLHM
jgi:hypothetical protein